MVVEPNGQEVIRQYDLASGRVLSDLRAGVVPSDGVFGFGWAPDGRALVVAVAPGGVKPGGVYVVDRDARQLLSRPTLTPEPGSAFSGPAMLANGHVVAFESRWPVERSAWPTTLVDVDLRTGARRTVMGSFNAPHPLFLNLDNPIDARGDQALFTDGDLITWLYDGRTARRIASGNNASRW
jgi:hypothetical protein